MCASSGGIISASQLRHSNSTIDGRLRVLVPLHIMQSHCRIIKKVASKDSG